MRDGLTLNDTRRLLSTAPAEAMTAWKYSTTIKSTSPDYPALALAAAAPIPSSLDTLLASSTLQLDIRVLADGQQLGASSLEGSALLREVRGWFDEVRETSSPVASLIADRVARCSKRARSALTALETASRMRRACQVRSFAPF